MPAVEVRNIVKHFGTVKAVEDVSFVVQAGEFVSLLGPSGCGKTTTLRMIAGFEHADYGEIRIADQDVTSVPPNRRDTGMVFQNYALFPHMSVFDNISFGLRMRKVPRGEIPDRVHEALKTVRMEGYEQRFPRQLSGGQQQRVALARAIVIRPKVLLLDEPLSNLDAKLRQEMRIELKRIQEETHIATIFVTHDQEEALALSDRAVLMNWGRVEQIGPPFEIYERPATPFAAQFIGQSNFFRGTVTVVDGSHSVALRTDDGLTLRALATAMFVPGQRALAVVRQERVQVHPRESAAGLANAFDARIHFINFLGSSVQYLCDLGGIQVIASTPNDRRQPLQRVGDTVTLAWGDDDTLALVEGSS
ncbi:MAG: ABC transporter ATP-binding protein [Chloroflexi bacterium]|nr:ABC transporter ATP-binding protein [Chloroflexota bacterium]